MYLILYAIGITLKPAIPLQKNEEMVAFDQLLAEAAGAILEEGTPLIHSLMAWMVKHIPDEIPKKEENKRMRRVANTQVFARSEIVRLEREYQQRQSLSNGHASEVIDPKYPSHISAESKH